MRSYEIWLQYELIYCQCQNYRTGKINYRTDPNPRGIGIRRSTKVRYFTVLLYSWLRSIILALTVSKNVYNTSYESILWTTKNGWVMTGTGQCCSFDPHGPMVEGCLRSILCQSSQFPTSVGQIPSPISLRWNPHRSMDFHGFGAEIHHFWQAIHLPTPLPSCTLKTACAQLRLKSPRRFTSKSFSNSTDLALQKMWLKHPNFFLQMFHVVDLTENVVDLTENLEMSQKSHVRKGLKIANFKKVCEILRSVFWKSNRNSTKLMEFGGIVKTWRKLHIFLEE